MCNNEAEPSTLENENEEKRSSEELFAEIMKSLEEYTTEKAETVLSNKSKLLFCLKTHRPIKIGNYFYGLSLNLVNNRRLIVFEWNDRARIREYTRTNHRENLWICRECFRLHGQKHTRPNYIPGICTYLYLVSGIVFASVNHDCIPRDYKLVMQYQKFLNEGNTTKARSMSKTVSFAFEQNSFANVVNVIDDACATLPKRLTNVESENLYDNKIVTETSTSLKQKLNDKSRILSTEKPPMNKRKRNYSEAEEIGHSGNKICTTAAKKQKIKEDPVKTYSFEMPSTSKLKKICDKLDVKYSKEAKGFWNEIKFQKIDFSSKNIKTQKYKEKNFYKILSNFLTGRFCNYEQIYYSINCAFRDKLIADGEMPFEEIDLVCSSYTVTDKHLKFIAKYFPCRILIFNLDKHEVKKF